MSVDLSLRPSTSPKIKQKPAASVIKVPFDYATSDDGLDENLLVLLHGLGDTHVPFGKLGRSLKLPQTATLALRAPELIPYLYEEAYQWYPSFDALGESLLNPNPSSAVDLVLRVISHLVKHCSWPSNRIHLFGFAQGGTVAAEAGLRWWSAELARASKQEVEAPQALGSIITVCGPLVSYPSTFATSCPTPVLVAHRPAPAETALPKNALAAFRKGYSVLSDVSMGPGEGMPRSRDEWQPIMRFWSERLSRRPVEGLYEVTSDAAPIA